MNDSPLCIECRHYTECEQTPPECIGFQPMDIISSDATQKFNNILDRCIALVKKQGRIIDGMGHIRERREALI